MMPLASQALLFACLAIPVAAVARFNWARRRELAADIGPLDDHGDGPCLHDLRPWCTWCLYEDAEVEIAVRGGAE